MMLVTTLYLLLTLIITLNSYSQDHVADFAYHGGSIFCAQIAAPKAIEDCNHKYLVNLNQSERLAKSQFSFAANDHRFNHA